MTRRHRSDLGIVGLKRLCIRRMNAGLSPAVVCRCCRGDSSCRERFEKDGEVPVVVSGEGKNCS